MDRKLLIGADPFPPYQYLDANGVVQGTDFELVREAFVRAGYQIEVRLDAWPIVEAAARSGELDAAFQVQRTPERESLYQFSDLLRQATTEVITSNPYLRRLDSYKDIATRHLIVGVMANYAYGEEIDSLDTSYKQEYADQTTLLKAISSGEVDIGIFDQGVKMYLMQKAGIDNLHVIDELTFERPLYVIFSDPVLRDAFNAGLQAMQSGNG